MTIEELVERYCRVSKELCQSWDRRIQEISSRRKYGKIAHSIEENITRELNQMEEALREGNMMKAEYYKLIVETYFDLME